MKTLTAILAHAGVGALQALAATQFANPSTPGGALANTYVQFGAQAALLAVQAALARKNSASDQQGNPLPQASAK